MPEDTKENLKELLTGYVKDLVEIITILEKRQEKVCSICPSRRTCKVKDDMKKSFEKMKQTHDIPTLAAFVGNIAEKVSTEIHLQTIMGMLTRKTAPDKGTIIKIE